MKKFFFILCGLLLSIAVLFWYISFPWPIWFNKPLMTFIETHFPREVVMPPKHVTITIGQQGKDFVAMYPKDIVVNDKNANGEVVFYDIDWPDVGPYGIVRVAHAKHSFDVEHVLGLMGTYDSSYPEEGIYNFNISLDLSDAPTISHQAAQKEFYGLLQRIQHAGWKRCLYPDDPRISGRGALVYSQTVSSLYSPDVDYYPTFDEWMLINNMTKWYFYADGVYLKVELMRDQKHLNPAKPGGYFITLTLENKNSIERLYFDYEDRANWKAKYPAERKSYEEKRPIAEQKIRAEGKFKIDTSYVQPDE